MSSGPSIHRVFVFLFGCFILLACNTGKKYETWAVAGGSRENIRYSTLNQIDTSNVNGLKMAWTYNSTGTDTIQHSQIQCNPIIVDGVLFGTSPQLKLFALNAATGEEMWVFNPHESLSPAEAPKSMRLNANRGVVYWQGPHEDDTRRIFYTVGPFLFAVNAESGKVIPGFGKNGRVDLHEGLGREVSDLFITSNSPGIIYKDLLIIGSRVSEGSDAAPGHIRAYDARTGRQAWIFHTIPQPGEFGFDSWEDSAAYKHIGGANSWAGFSLDEQRGILFAPTGSASFDFYGGMRKGANLFANCILALDAATGKYIWHYQTVHHDVWDMDLPTAPSLVTATVNGKKVDAVAQPTKTGFVFLLDRETGKPLFPIEERPVSTETDLVGEKLSPTQPFPTWPKPFMRQGFSEADLNGLMSDSSLSEMRSQLGTIKTGKLFTPPSLTGTVFFPGLDGGAEWGGAAFDPASQLFYVNSNEIPWVITMKEINPEIPKDETLLTAGKRLYTKNCMACHGPDRKGSGNFPSIVNAPTQYNEKTFAQLLASGRRMMPGFQDLSEEEGKAIASFVLNLKFEQGKKFVGRPVVADPYRNLRYSITGYNKFFTKEGFPANQPPWGSLNAINLSTGDIEWKVPLGGYPELKKKGIETGAENYGGPVVTTGGLVFIAASMDGKIRAFDKRNGKVLWENGLPAPGFATPSTYMAGGKQFVVIACGGGKLGTRSGDAYVAFALP